MEPLNQGRRWGRDPGEGPPGGPREVPSKLDWWSTLNDEDRERFGLSRAGISAEREAELLAAWHARG